LMMFAALVGALFPQAASNPKSDVQTQWQTTDQLCGQLELVAPKKKRIIVNGKSELHLYIAYLAINCFSTARAANDNNCASESAFALRFRRLILLPQWPVGAIPTVRIRVYPPTEFCGQGGRQAVLRESQSPADQENPEVPDRTRTGSGGKSILDG
jgi:hypothetical protein